MASLTSSSRNFCSRNELLQPNPRMNFLFPDGRISHSHFSKRVRVSKESRKTQRNALNRSLMPNQGSVLNCYSCNISSVMLHFVSVIFSFPRKPILFKYCSRRRRMMMMTWVERSLPLKATSQQAFSSFHLIVEVKDRALVVHVFMYHTVLVRIQLDFQLFFFF